MSLRLEKVSKLYPNGVFGVREISCRIKPGILGVLGPNGAGKSTLLRMLATILRPSEGSAFWKDIDIFRKPNALRKVLGYLPQEFVLPDQLTAPEYLRYIALLKGMDKRKVSIAIDSLLNAFNLDEVKRHKIGTYSGGMKQRVGLAQALMNNPDVLLLDEPGTGLDPQERIGLRNIIQELAMNKIVILSSHIVSEVEILADRVAIILDGKLVAHGSVSELVDPAKIRVWETGVTGEELEFLKSRYTVTATSRTTEGLRARSLSEHAPLDKSVPVAPTLEDAYMQFVTSTKGGQCHG